MIDTIQEWFTKYLNLPPQRLPGAGLSIGLTDTLDIFIVAVIVYLILQWIRKTRAWTLFKGILILMVIYGLATVFKFMTVSWIVEIVFSEGLIAVIVLFQPEFRKALEQIGRGKYITHTFTRNGQISALSLYTVNEIVKAAYTMSKVKTGALIVLEQMNSLSEFEGTGIAVDAAVSSELIINIFEKNTPLHDGAVLIRQNRVAAAACILPLTDLEIDSGLGTRHRASIGMSEASDAVVVVVSEETGAVSVAAGGKLTRELNDNQLREITAWVFNISLEHVALISEEITLIR